MGNYYAYRRAWGPEEGWRAWYLSADGWRTVSNAQQRSIHYASEAAALAQARHAWEATQPAQLELPL